VDDTLVAKIYDPLYYDALSDNGYPEDVVWHADSAYTREAAAYNHIWHSKEVTDPIPLFHSTWTMDIESTLSLDGKAIHYTRSVRLILI
jgi:hypothetical protein